MPLISQAEYATLQGKTRAAITAWKKRGWLILKDKLVDVDASNARLKRYRKGGNGAVNAVNPGNKTVNTLNKGNRKINTINREVNKVNREVNTGNSEVNKPDNKEAQGNKLGNKKPKVTIEPGESTEDAVVRILSANGADWDINEAKRIKENYLALLNQLEYDQKSGQVAAVADVVKAVGEEYAKVRTRLLSIPSEQAPRLHRLKTVSEVQSALREMITAALEELTRDGARG